MMAAAEARAAWQRTANRCFVHEDAKRAPKLSSSLTKQVNTRSPGHTDVPDKENFASFFAPFDQNSSYSNLSQDSRWWLHLQPNCIYQRGLTKEEVNTLDARNSHQFVDNENDGIKQDVKTFDIMDYEFVEINSVDCCPVSKEVNEFNLDSKFPHWMGSEKSQELPWWQMSDKDDLASFVAHKSHDFIENCDLPQPMNTSFKKDSYAYDEKDAIFTPSGSWKSKGIECQNVTIVHTRQNTMSGVELQSVTSKPIRETMAPKMDGSKGKLLEALRHSQTRAREAEKAAKEAYAEKEHVIKLIFKQASQLFAYKQWLYLLQLENLYYQINNTHKTRKKRKILPKNRAKKGYEKHGIGIGKYAVVVAVGLGLVGAGLLLGWTVGWMLI